MVNFDNMNLMGPFTNLYHYVKKTYVQYVVKVIKFEIKMVIVFLSLLKTQLGGSNESNLCKRVKLEKNQNGINSSLTK